MQALAAPGLTQEKATAAAPGLRQLIAKARSGVQRSNEMLAAMPPFPVQGALPFAPQQLLADARTQNGRFLALLADFETFVAAMGKGDRAAMGRVLPRIGDGALSMMTHQALILRSRQAMMPATDTAHQSIGVTVQLYRAMEVVGRQMMAAASGGSAGAGNAERLREQLRPVVSETRALTATGRVNLTRELGEIKRARSAATSDADRRLIDRVTRVTQAEEAVFGLGDRLATTLEQGGGASGAALSQPALKALYAKLVGIEAEMVRLNMEQAALLGNP
jgi:hypothetical protein